MVPLFKKYIIKIEPVQRNFTRFVNISNTSYKDRLVKLGFESLEYRIWQFDLVTLFKILNGKYREFFNNFFIFSQTKYNFRGNDKNK